MQKKKILLTAVACSFALMLGGCAMFAPVKPTTEMLVNGTTAGNIQNLGFAAKQGDELYFYYTGGDAYEIGDIVKSNPDTGENSFLLHDGGFYISIYDDSLYYCREDGIYRAPMDTFEAQLVLKGQATQLQISDGQLYYIEDGTIKSAAADGQATGFSPIQGAACLNVAEAKLYYIDSASGQIWQAEKDGSGAEMLFDVNAKQLIILNDTFYYIDSTDEQIKRVSADKTEPETVLPYACGSFNINAYGMFYTREIDGQRVCCSASIDGENEQVIEGSASTSRHMICMFDGGAVIVRAEDFETAAE